MGSFGFLWALKMPPSLWAMTGGASVALVCMLREFTIKIWICISTKYSSRASLVRDDVFAEGRKCRLLIDPLSRKQFRVGSRNHLVCVLSKGRVWVCVLQSTESSTLWQIWYLALSRTAVFYTSYWRCWRQHDFHHQFTCSLRRR